MKFQALSTAFCLILAYSSKATENIQTLEPQAEQQLPEERTPVSELKLLRDSISKLALQEMPDQPLDAQKYVKHASKILAAASFLKRIFSMSKFFGGDQENINLSQEFFAKGGRYFLAAVVMQQFPMEFFYLHNKDRVVLGQTVDRFMGDFNYIVKILKQFEDFDLVEHPKLRERVISFVKEFETFKTQFCNFKEADRKIQVSQLLDANKRLYEALLKAARSEDHTELEFAKGFQKQLANLRKKYAFLASKEELAILEIETATLQRGFENVLAEKLDTKPYYRLKALDPNYKVYFDPQSKAIASFVEWVKSAADAPEPSGTEFRFQVLLKLRDRVLQKLPLSPIERHKLNGLLSEDLLKQYASDVSSSAALDQFEPFILLMTNLGAVNLSENIQHIREQFVGVDAFKAITSLVYAEIERIHTNYLNQALDIRSFEQLAMIEKRAFDSAQTNFRVSLHNTEELVKDIVGNFDRYNIGIEQFYQPHSSYLVLNLAVLDFLKDSNSHIQVRTFPEVLFSVKDKLITYRRYFRFQVMKAQLLIMLKGEFHKLEIELDRETMKNLNADFNEIYAVHKTNSEKMIQAVIAEAGKVFARIKHTEMSQEQKQRLHDLYTFALESKEFKTNLQNRLIHKLQIFLLKGKIVEGKPDSVETFMMDEIYEKARVLQHILHFEYLVHKDRLDSISAARVFDKYFSMMKNSSDPSTSMNLSKREEEILSKIRSRISNLAMVLQGLTVIREATNKANLIENPFTDQVLEEVVEKYHLHDLLKKEELTHEEIADTMVQIFNWAMNKFNFELRSNRFRNFTEESVIRLLNKPKNANTGYKEMLHTVLEVIRRNNVGSKASNLELDSLLSAFKKELKVLTLDSGQWIQKAIKSKTQEASEMISLPLPSRLRAGLSADEKRSISRGVRTE